ncbi:hypothetical protein B0H14DRAFT_2556981 [Mycena olivaceomarginata]|nr:hypothetical protein B0H14DRAFT_2556981 [Mycena olivaceomarginata]
MKVADRDAESTPILRGFDQGPDQWELDALVVVFGYTLLVHGPSFVELGSQAKCERRLRKDGEKHSIDTRNGYAKRGGCLARRLLRSARKICGGEKGKRKKEDAHKEPIESFSKSLA